MGIKVKASVSRGEGYVSVGFWSEPEATASFSGSLSSSDPDVVALFDGIDGAADMVIAVTKDEAEAAGADDTSGEMASSGEAGAAAGADGTTSTAGEGQATGDGTAA